MENAVILLASSWLLVIATAQTPLTAEEKYMPQHKIPDLMQPILKRYEGEYALAHFKPVLNNEILHSFKARVAVRRRDQECFSEKCTNGSMILANFQSDTPPGFVTEGTLSSYIRAVNGTVYYGGVASTKGEITVTCSDSGFYEYCLDNRNDKYSSKVVDFELSLFKSGLLGGFHIEKAVLNDTMHGLYDQVFQVSRDVLKSASYLFIQQAHTRRDYELHKSNKRMVDNFSILSIILVACVSYCQVRYLKRMFNLNERPANGKCGTRL